MSNERLYTEKEISKILEQAGKRQSEQGDQETHGLTLAELQQIAKEVGLSPSIVATVAEELDGSYNSGDWITQFGVPTKINIERIIPGEVREEDWPQIVQMLEESVGVVGASGQIGQSLEWTHTSKFVQYRVSFHPTQGGTKVRVFGNFTRQARALTLPLTLFFTFQAFIFPFAANLGVPLSIGLGLTAGLMVYILTRFGFTSSLRKKENTLNRTISRIEREIAKGSETVSRNLDKQAELPELDVDEAVRGEEEPVRRKGRHRN